MAMADTDAEHENFASKFLSVNIRSQDAITQSQSAKSSTSLQPNCQTAPPTRSYYVSTTSPRTTDIQRENVDVE